jgi:ribonuclease-3
MKNLEYVNLKDLYQVISYEFKKPNLLILALTHPSAYAKKKYKATEYQRLEFLGDRVISFVLGSELYKTFPEDQAGALSKKYSIIASGETMQKIALQIGLDKVIILSKGEEQTDGRTKKSHLENTLEALIGAIFLDSDINTAKNIILKYWTGYISNSDLTDAIINDAKNQLQEYSQAKYKIIPIYEITEITGARHEQTFTAKVTIEGENVVGVGIGKSKKEAEKNAAIDIINLLKIR